MAPRGGLTSAREMWVSPRPLVMRSPSLSHSLPSASDYLFKLLLIGDSGVGKSCLLLRFAVRDVVPPMPAPTQTVTAVQVVPCLYSLYSPRQFPACPRSLSPLFASRTTLTQRAISAQSA